MKINKVQYGRALGIIGALALAVILLPIFMGCATKQGTLRVNAQGILTKETQSKANSKTIQQAVKKALDSTVRLVMQDANGKYLEVGSGFFVRPNLIATNFYVMNGVLGDELLVDGDTKYNIESLNGYAQLVGKDTTYNIESIFSDVAHRLVLLEVTAPDVEPLSLGDSDTIQRGTPVYAMETPSESEDMFSKGIMTYRSIEDGMTSVGQDGFDAIEGLIIHGPYLYLPNVEWLGLTSQISRKGSGGPVLNGKGEVIGVSSHRGVSDNYCMISSKTLKDLLRLK